MVAVIAIAAVGVYLLASAAVAFVGWLLRVAIRHRPGVVAETAAPPPPTSAPCRSILMIDPAVFANDAATREFAKRAFERWVSCLPHGPRRSIDLVRSVDIRTRNVGRLATELEGRRVIECCEPAPGREPLRAPAPPGRRSIHGTHHPSCCAPVAPSRRRVPRVHAGQDEDARVNRASGGLLCNDGTRSPTCTCGGSHRNCCSWHGGIAGCQ